MTNYLSSAFAFLVVGLIVTESSKSEFSTVLGVCLVAAAFVRFHQWWRGV